MNKATLLTLSLLAGPALAQCDRDTLVAQYRLEPTSQPAQSLTLVRQGSRVALHWPAEGVTERWTRLANGQLQLERLFDHYQRGIEYQADEIATSSGERLWQLKHQLITQAALAALPLIEDQGSGCDAHQLRTRGDTELVWLTGMGLIETLAAPHQHLSLVKLQTGDEAVRGWMDDWDSYRLTDYADIGDNEQDPLLSKMINQGFPGRQERGRGHPHHH
ncbi:hypothetical protein FCL40_05850 [Ferrimonas sediminicola]|uniref:DUF1481 domain-containing protein n=1 Tax=Ferrimonas sediminicola TaxID=2569538 RepID=A0A4U1BJE5_9GAMM|nr:hypothetical protein [Ferrimonas sediminicola]TKB50669.1 hypothetical protein FCL40_05850 [Ferrimonas sediminicola]